MLVFVDECGDPGFKLDSGSSRHLVIALVIFDLPVHAEAAAKQMSDLRRELGFPGVQEFKFNRLKSSYREQFFSRVAPTPFRIRAIVVDKGVIYKDFLRSSPRDFYRFVATQLISHHFGAVQNAKIFIDGSGSREFRREFGAHLRKQAPPGTIGALAFEDSKNNQLIQLADMVAGGIARAYHPQTAESRYLSILKSHGRIEDIWLFK